MENSPPRHPNTYNDAPMSRHGEADHDDHGGDPVGGRQGSATGAEPDSRELQTTEDAAEHARQHGWEGVGGDRQVDPQGDGSGEPSQEMTAVMQTAAMIRSAPLPAPHEFKGYEAVLPGAADRILRMAEKDQDSLIAARAADVEDRHTATRAEARAFVAAA